MKRIVIVGGGIAGLAAAHRLARETRGAAVTLIESETRLGGKILTERVGGLGGPYAWLIWRFVSAHADLVSAPPGAEPVST